MTDPLPPYTSENVRFAYQLNWSLTVFWREPLWDAGWFPALQAATEPDGIRLLEHRFSRPDISLFLVSTRPDVVPVEIPRRVKGRLQHLLRSHVQRPFQRNYDLRSLGSTVREKLEAYVANQLEHHGETLLNSRSSLADLQVIRTDVDLSQPRFTSHARYWCNLHLVLVRINRSRETEWKALETVRATILKVSEAQGHLLSRLGVLTDHLHLLFGFSPEESPVTIGLLYMNQIALAGEKQAVFQSSCFVGTFGEYDLGAIR